jgi:signal transduction histidine kinase
MRWEQIWDWIAPQAAESDDGFGEEIARLSQRSLYIIGAVEFGMPLISLFFGLLLDPAIRERFHFRDMLPYFLVGGIAIGAGRIESLRRHFRLIAYAIGTATAALMVWQHLQRSRGTGAEELVLVINLMVVLLVGTAAIPGRPLHMLAMGVTVMICRVGLTSLVFGAEPALEVLRSSHSTHFLPAATVLCAGLAGANYHRIHAAYLAYQEAVRVQSRLLMAETAALMGRFAAGLSHELNNASSALKSAIETLDLIAARKPNARGPVLEKLEKTEGELRLSAREAVGRLQETVRKMQRLANLDRAERLVVDLNALLTDVVSLAAPDIPEGVRVQTDLGPLPKVTLRPQLVSAVFSQLVHKAAEDAKPQGTVLLVTQHRESWVEIRVAGSVTGASQDGLEAPFELGFEVSGRRVRAGNWDLFSARQIIREHGGEIRVERGTAQWAAVCITLPC